VSRWSANDVHHVIRGVAVAAAAAWLPVQMIRTTDAQQINGKVIDHTDHGVASAIGILSRCLTTFQTVLRRQFIFYREASSTFSQF